MGINHRRADIAVGAEFLKDAGIGTKLYLANNFVNKRSASRSPSAVSTTDFALPTGFEMKPIHRIPIERFPGARPIMQREVQQGQNSFVNLVRVSFHRGLTSIILGIT